MVAAIPESNSRSAVRLPITYTSHPRTGWLGGALSLLMVFSAVWFFRQMWELAAVFIAMAAVTAFLSFMSLRRDRCYLKLTHEGFEFAGIFRKKFVAWRDVEKFVFVAGYEEERVGWRYTQRSTFAPPESLRRVVYELIDDFFPTSYRGVTQKELAALLNELLSTERPRGSPDR